MIPNVTYCCLCRDRLFTRLYDAATPWSEHTYLCPHCYKNARVAGLAKLYERSDVLSREWVYIADMFYPDNMR
jgi:hypothetical protein